jgi:hypothetical protein
MPVMSLRSRIFLFIIAVLLSNLVEPITVAAQAPGYAEIIYPQSGEAIFGLVTIEGSAAHPSFVAYELSFAHQPNTSDTWFPIMQPFNTPVTEGKLGIWDTTIITDGNYQLRLRVWLKSGNVLEAFVSDLRIRNIIPTETPTVTLPDARPSPSPIVPTNTPRPTPIPLPSNDGPTRVVRVFVIGGIVSAISLLLLGGYISIRKSMRQRWASLRMRQLHRQSEQKRNMEKRR